MTRHRITVSLAAVTATSVAVHLLRRRRWYNTLDWLASARDVTHLQNLRLAGMLTRAETVQIARWTGAYPPGTLLRALIITLTSATDVDRAAVKQMFLRRIAAQVGPCLPTGGHTFPAPVAWRADPGSLH